MFLHNNSIEIGLLSLLTLFGSDSLGAAQGDILKAKNEGQGAAAGNSIFNGTPASQGEFPFYAGIFSPVSGNSEQLWCGGALIAPEWILTAHHCVKSYDDGSDIPITKIIVNLWRFDTTTDTHQPAIEKTYLYSNSDSYVGNDLALIKLKSPINDPKTPPVVISTRRLNVGQAVNAIGLGRNGDNKIPDQLQKAEMQVLGSQYCSTKGNTIEAKRELCGGTPIADYNDQAGTGNGDSGGPLLIKDGGVWKQDAAVSRMALYSDQKFHVLTIFSEVSSDDFRQWIQATTKENVHYACDLKKVTDEGATVYQLESCGATGNWSNVAPYLIKASQRIKDCYYDLSNKSWDCPDKSTPIYHYKTYFSAPVSQPGGSYHTQATVPLTELGN